MFYCREKELNELNKRYNAGKFECVIIYGRRRVGKTALINEFCRNKPTVFFSAINSSSYDNLQALSKAIYIKDNPNSATAPVFNSFEDAFDAISHMAEEERIILVIDEYPYFAKSEKSISSKLQHIIDHIWQDSKLFLILCGSSVSFMENQVLGYESPLYGRRTAQLKIQPLTYKETAVFNKALSYEQQALVYGITGGVPHYINKLAVVDDIDEAVKNNLLNTSSYLFEEPENLLKQELREPALYNSIIAAVAGGASRLNEISTKVQMESAVCSKYIKTLLDLGILKKEIPFMEKVSKKTIYTIGDNFFRFWYRFVPQNLSSIYSDRIDRIYDPAVKRYYPDYMGLVFEQMCRDYIMRYDNNLPFAVSDVGQWWGTDNKNKKEVQIDIVASSAVDDRYIIGSCKYRNAKVSEDEYVLLKEYSKVFGKENNYFYYIFSKGGFTESLKRCVDNGDLRLISLDELYI